MRTLLREHFNEVLLTTLILVMTLVTLVILAHEGWQSASDGFKWSSNLVSGVIGALLALLMKGVAPPTLTPGTSTSTTVTATSTAVPVGDRRKGQRRVTAGGRVINDGVGERRSGHERRHP